MDTPHAESPFGALVIDSLERLAERDVDLTLHVYARLFAARPEFQPLFLMGPAAKGYMLDEVIRLMLDFADSGAYGEHMLAAERVNHENLGVPGADFLGFLDIVAQTVADLCGPDWTGDHARAWRETIAALKAAAGIDPTPGFP